MNTINDLNKAQATLYRSYVKANQMDVNQQAKITAYMEQGKAGHDEILGIVELMKVNNESTAKIKTQVSRASGKQKSGLSLQGLGKDDVAVIAPKKASTKDKQEVAEKAPKEVELSNDEVATGLKSITHEQAWEFVEKYFTLDEVEALRGAVKARVTEKVKKIIAA
tara:strand:- start:105 stop:602 length:498 start_codon:yes stop_codon:yes gene_type:complete